MKKERTPLNKVTNFGPVTLAEFEAMGIIFLEEIESMFFEEICRRWVQYFPDRLNANAFLGIACAIDGISWTKATSEHRGLAHSLVSQLRKEYFLPPAKKTKPRQRLKK